MLNILNFCGLKDLPFTALTCKYFYNLSAFQMNENLKTIARDLAGDKEPVFDMLMETPALKVRVMQAIASHFNQNRAQVIQTLLLVSPGHILVTRKALSILFDETTDEKKKLNFFNALLPVKDSNALDLDVLFDAACRCDDGMRGFQKNEEKATQLYILVADQGHAKAQFNLGITYEDGCGVERDDVKAVEYYTLAADQGHAKAQFHLGVMYEHGCGVEKDEAKAAAYYKLAADQGHAGAQFNLGVRYVNGCGVEKDDRKAVEYYKLAADQGISEAEAQLEALTNLMRN